MGKGSSPIAPISKVVGEVSPTVNYLNKQIEKDEGLQKQSPTSPQLSNGTSSRQVVSSSSSGSIKKVYDKEDKKR